MAGCLRQGSAVSQGELAQCESLLLGFGAVHSVQQLYLAEKHFVGRAAVL